MYQIVRLLIPGAAALLPVFRRLRSLNCALPMVLVVWLAVGCGAAANTEPSRPPAQRIKVVTTTTVLADLAESVGGNLVEVASLVPTGADVHSFQTTPSHSVTIGQARVLISNGAGLDDFLQPVLASARPASAVHIVASRGLDLQLLEEEAFPGGGHKSGDEPGHGEGSPEGDPHFWLDPILAIHYVERIRDGLVRADPANSQVYSDNARDYAEQLRSLDREIAQTLRQVPPPRRHLVTFHDAYGYFARRYGWRVSAFVAGDASEVTPRAVVRVMERISQEGIPAVFAEPQFSSDVLRDAARDAGVRVGTIRSLPDDTAPTYLEMMRSNARSLTKDLRDFTPGYQGAPNDFY